MAGGSSGQQGGQTGGSTASSQPTQAVGSNYNPYSTGGFQNQYQPQNQPYQPWMQQQSQNWNPYAQQQQQFQQQNMYSQQRPMPQGGYGFDGGFGGGYGGGFNRGMGMAPPWARQQHPGLDESGMNNPNNYNRVSTPAPSQLQQMLAALQDKVGGQQPVQSIEPAAAATPAANPFDSSQDAYNTWLSQHKQPTYEDWSQGINKQKSQYDSMMAQIGQDVARQIQSPYQQQQPMFQQRQLPSYMSPYMAQFAGIQ